MDWTVVALTGEDGADIVLSLEKERIKELNSLGYHLADMPTDHLTQPTDYHANMLAPGDFNHSGAIFTRC